MPDAIVPTLVTIRNSEPRVLYAAIPGRPSYAAATNGVIWSRKSGVWLPMQGTPGESGHLTVGLWDANRKRTQWVHILVLEAWVGPCPDGMECRHLNGIPDDNRLTNIEWNTRRVNTQDRKRHGNRRVFGEGHHAAIFTDDEVLAIRERVGAGEDMRAVAISINKSERAVRKAAHGVTYDHLPGAVAKRRPPMLISDQMVQYLREQFDAGRRQGDLERETGIPHYTISRIVNRKSHAS